MTTALERVRNIGIVAHIDAGKTTTTERLLYYAGRTHRMGEVDAGTTVTDFDPEEQQRGITIYSAAVTLEWLGHGINLIDTPGHVDFTAEVERALRVLDGALVIFDAKEGAEAQSETVWRQATKYHVARLCFVNKMDRLGADFFAAVRSLRDRLGASPVVLQLPIGAEDGFEGVVDLVGMRALRFVPEGDDKRMEVDAIPGALVETAAEWRRTLEETVADLDERLLEKFVQGEPMTEEELRAAVRRGTLADRVHPVLCGSARNKIGTRLLLDAVVDYLPSPLDVPPVVGERPGGDGERVELRCDPRGPLAAYVFKIVADKPLDQYFVRIYSGVLRAGTRVLDAGRDHKENVSRLYRVFARRREAVEEASAGDIVAAMGPKEALTGDTLCEAAHPVVLERIAFPETVVHMAIEPRATADQDKLQEALRALARQDPTFEVRTDPETGQTVIGGMGELHLEVLCHRLVRDMHVPVNLGKPRVSYRETVAGEAEAEGRFERQLGAQGLFAVVRLRVEGRGATAGDGAVAFESRLDKGALRAPFVRAIEAGVREAARRGVLAGYAMIQVKVTLLGAEEHEHDSNEAAFEMAARLAFEEAALRAEPRMMEPIMRLELAVPEAYFGAVVGDLGARRAVISGTEMRGDRRQIVAEVPVREMMGYSTVVRSLTQGRASWSLAPLRYEVAPEAVAEEVKAKAWW